MANYFISKARAERYANTCRNVGFPAWVSKAGWLWKVSVASTTLNFNSTSR